MSKFRTRYTVALIFASFLSAIQASHNGIPIEGTPLPTNNEAVSRNPNAPSPSAKYPYSSQLDPNYELFWMTNETHITFEAIVRTNGWIGLGISPQGSMLESDVVIGWISNGEIHFADRHTVAHALPPIDESQDWHLLHGREEGEYTALTMTRKLETCDENDISILDGTTRVIYAYNPNDPVKEEQISYHGVQNRGTKSMLLLNPSGADKEEVVYPPDTKTFDFVVENHAVGSGPTEYHCATFRGPNLTKKHHMIRYEPVVQAGNEKHVHHMLLYYCNNMEPDDTNVGVDYTCYSDYQFRDCQTVLAGWAVGATAFDFPPNVGYSFGADEDPKLFRLEIHYDNPTRRSDIVDSSGFRFFLTSELRQHDAGTMEVGMRVNSLQAVPPGYPDFLSTGYCTDKCLGEGMGNNEEIHIFANFLHSHLLGRKLRTRHIRNGTELPVVAEDNNYDFDYQETRLLQQEVTVRKGDMLVMECELDSTGRSTVTYGGLGTHDEMCLAIISYYPRLPLSQCLSSPRGANELLYQLDFTKTADRVQFQKRVNDADLSVQCSILNHPYYGLEDVPKPVISTPLQTPPSACSGYRMNQAVTSPEPTPMSSEQTAFRPEQKTNASNENNQSIQQ